MLKSWTKCIVVENVSESGSIGGGNTYNSSQRNTQSTHYLKCQELLFNKSTHFSRSKFLQSSNEMKSGAWFVWQLPCLPVQTKQVAAWLDCQTKFDTYVINQPTSLTVPAHVVHWKSQMRLVFERTEFTVLPGSAGTCQQTASFKCTLYLWNPSSPQIIPLASTIQWLAPFFLSLEPVGFVWRQKCTRCIAFKN